MTFIPGILHVLAVMLRRPSEPLSPAWSLHPHVLKSLWLTLDHAHVILFTSHLYSRLPAYFTPIQEPQALAVDAFQVVC